MPALPAPTRPPFRSHRRPERARRRLHAARNDQGRHHGARPRRRRYGGVLAGDRQPRPRRWISVPCSTRCRSRCGCATRRCHCLGQSRLPLRPAPKTKQPPSPHKQRSTNPNAIWPAPRAPKDTRWKPSASPSSAAIAARWPSPHVPLERGRHRRHRHRRDRCLECRSTTAAAYRRPCRHARQAGNGRRDLRQRPEADLLQSRLCTALGTGRNWLDRHPTDGEILDRLREARKLPEQRDYQAWKRARLALYETGRRISAGRTLASCRAARPCASSPSRTPLAG